MKLIVITFLLSLINFMPCNAQERSPHPDVVSISGETTDSQPIKYFSSRTIEKENMYIDVDFDFVGEALNKHVRENRDKMLSDPQIAIRGIMKEYPQEFEMSRAAWHRFFSNGKIVDHVWECSAKTASELNMSERTFNVMVNSMAETRQDFEKAQADGATVHDMAITQGYLDGLISEIPTK